jgi:glutaredoxin-related protein
LDIGEKLLYLKQFLKIRDGNECFEPVRQRGQIGIPCIVREDGTVTFEWDEYLK